VEEKTIMGTSSKFKGRKDNFSIPFDSSVLANYDMVGIINPMLVTWEQMKNQTKRYITTGITEKLSKSIAIFVLKSGGAEVIASLCAPGLKIFVQILFAIYGIKVEGNSELIKIIENLRKVLKGIEFIEKVLDWVDIDSSTKSDSINKKAILDSFQDISNRMNQDYDVDDLVSHIKEKTSNAISDFLINQIYLMYMNEIEYKFEDCSLPFDEIMKRREEIKSYIQVTIEEVIKLNKITSILDVNDAWILSIYNKISKAMVTRYGN